MPKSTFRPTARQQLRVVQTIVLYDILGFVSVAFVAVTFQPVCRRPLIRHADVYQRNDGSHHAIAYDETSNDTRLGRAVLMQQNRLDGELPIAMFRLTSRRLVFYTENAALTDLPSKTQAQIRQALSAHWNAEGDITSAAEVLLPDFERRHLLWPGVAFNLVIYAVVGAMMWSLVRGVRLMANHVSLEEHRLQALREDRCPTCGYDIRLLPDCRCPECGETWRADEVESNATAV